MSRVKIQAGESCPYPVGDDITGTATLRIEGTVANNVVTPAYLATEYADYENVIVKVINAEKEIIKACTLKASNNFIAAGLTINYLLNIENTDDYTYLPNSDLWNYKVENSTFVGPSSITVKDNVGGLYVTNHRNFVNFPTDNVVNTTFTDFNFGIFAEADECIKISGATISDCYFPIYTYNVYQYLCSSELTSASLAVECDYGTFEGYDNTISDVIYGIHITSSWDSYLRGNLFEDYSAHALYTNNTPVWLRPVWSAGPDFLILGRNTFNGTEGASDIYITGPPSTGGAADIFIVCGFNLFNDVSTYHWSLTFHVVRTTLDSTTGEVKPWSILISSLQDLRGMNRELPTLTVTSIYWRTVAMMGK